MQVGRLILLGLLGLVVAEAAVFLMVAGLLGSLPALVLLFATSILGGLVLGRMGRRLAGRLADMMSRRDGAVIEASGGLEAKRVLQHGPDIHLLFSDARIAGDNNAFALAQWVRRFRPKIAIVLNASLTKKSEAAAHLCSRNQPNPPPASHLRDRIKAMKASHAPRQRTDRRPKAYKRTG